MLVRAINIISFDWKQNADNIINIKSSFFEWHPANQIFWIDQTLWTTDNYFRMCDELYYCLKLKKKNFNCMILTSIEKWIRSFFEREMVAVQLSQLINVGTFEPRISAFLLEVNEFS